MAPGRVGLTGFEAFLVKTIYGFADCRPWGETQKRAGEQGGAEDDGEEIMIGE